MSGLVILHRISPLIGWTPVSHMVNLAQQELGASLRVAPENSSRISRQVARLRGRRAASGRPHLLFVAMTAADLRHAITSTGWRDSYDSCAVWIIDSFHTDLINPRDLKRHFDQIFVTRRNDVDAFCAATGLPTEVLPWGCDALGLCAIAPPRDLDLLRVGRQPPVWEDDTAAARDCAAQGVAFHGRPPMGVSDDEVAHLFSWYARSKFVLASSNLVSPADYVHKTEEYVTARWTDALAAGAIVAGVPPKSDQSYSDMLWPEAVLEIPLNSRAAGLEVIAEALADWSPARAKFNRQQALARLDWRHRFARLADFFSLEAPQLHKSLSLIESKLNE